MIRRYSAHFQVRSFELDGWREVPTRMLAAYMEQAAWEASARSALRRPSTKSWARPGSSAAHAGSPWPHCL